MNKSKKRGPSNGPVKTQEKNKHKKATYTQREDALNAIKPSLNIKINESPSKKQQSTSR